jgi:hypothetical protein
MSDGEEGPEGADAPQPRIAPEDAINDIVVPPIEERALGYLYDDEFARRSALSEIDYAKLVGLRDHFRHKRFWSWFLMAIMAAMVIFQSYLIWQVGIGAWNFKGYDWLLPTLMIQYLIQIVGLAVFVVRSLFKDMS